MIRYKLVFLVSLLFITLNTLSSEQRNCIILVDYHSCTESLGQSWRFYLMSRLQSAIAEQSTPILVSASLWNSFIERRISFEQNLENKNSNESTILNLYKEINERSAYWSAYYNNISADAVHNKALVAQRLNQEFLLIFP